MTFTSSIKLIIENEFEEVWNNKKAKEIDKSIKAKNFNALALYKKILTILVNDYEVQKTYLNAKSKISNEAAETFLFYSVFRFSFLSQIVWKKGGAANYTAHWFTPPFKDSDPRIASCEECFQIFKTVINRFNDLLDDLEKSKNLQIAISNKITCIDYKERLLDKQIHCVNNIYWIEDDFPSRLIRLKNFLTSKVNNPETFKFFKIACKKIYVKTYLTDRSQTGGYQTNREYRWETHPNSVQFALYRNCLEIEYKLLKQVLEFYGFPLSIITSLQKEGIILSKDIIPESRRCPITMEKMSFNKFQEEMLNIEHGESRFQVGHINPLKANSTDVFVGHTAQNICWITDIGNEIQKNRSVSETQALIKRISQNYEEAGIFNTDTDK